ncbi:MAG: hypothetical protein ACRDHL_06225 [Candidatus Promineifilaceae bacterium]
MNRKSGTKRAAARLGLALLAAMLMAGGLWAAAAAAQADQPLPPAEPCGAPTIQVLSVQANVRAGPWVTYPALGALAEGDVRPLVGRHESIQWWAIEMPDGAVGWISNVVIRVDGNLEGLPLLPAPDTGAFVPSPAELWFPQSSAPCEAAASPAPEQTPTAVATPTATISPTLTPEPVAWSAARNLSRSGAAGEPILTSNGQGGAHLVWQDKVTGVMVSRVVSAGNGVVTWTPPAAMALPAEELPLRTPATLFDDDGDGQVFWIGPTEVTEADDETVELSDALLYSRVEGGDFGNGDAWTAPRILAQPVLDFTVARAADGRLLLSYLGVPWPAGGSAGVYYRQSGDDGENWSEPASLYLSAYLHPLVTEEGSIHMTTGVVDGVERILVAWDDRLQEKVFLGQSQDGGQSWPAPREVDRRAVGDNADAQGPANILVHARQNEILLLWQAGHAGQNCSQYFQHSADGGLSWGAATPMLASFQVCPEANHFLAGPERQPLLLTTIHSQAHLLAWNGQEWSGSQEQEALSGFVNTDTNQVVTLGCFQASLLAAGELLVVGCGQGLAGDIWALSRPLTSTADWFLPPAAWAAPGLVASLEAPPAGFELVLDRDGNAHLFWSQSNSRAVSYAFWNGANWSAPLALPNSPGGGTSSPAATASRSGRLLVSWRDASGQIFFSQASTADAILTSRWSSPQAIPAPAPAADTSAIASDGAGRAYIAYTVPLNEGRGIYLSRSEDEGMTWSEAAQVFDGAAQGWEMVGRPQIAAPPSGQVHALWTQRALPTSADRPGLALYYARSEDAGLTFSLGELVADAPISWSQLAAAGSGPMHRLWQVADAGVTAFWQATSADGGLTWQAANPLSNLDGLLATAQDEGSQLHLVQLADEVLQQWLWQDGGWQGQATLPLGPGRAEALAAAAGGGRLAAVYSGPAGPLTPTVGAQTGLYFSWRPIEPASETAQPELPTITPLATAESTTAAGASATPEAATPEPAGGSEQNTDAGPAAGPAGNPSPPLLIGILVAGALLTVITFVAFRVGRPRRS